MGILKWGKNDGIMKHTEKEVLRVKVTKETLIGEILELDIELGQFLLEMGMHCLGCPSARGESLEMACAVHGTDADELVKKMNEFLAAKEQK